MAFVRHRGAEGDQTAENSEALDSQETSESETEVKPRRRRVVRKTAEPLAEETASEETADVQTPSPETPSEEQAANHYGKPANRYGSANRYGANNRYGNNRYGNRSNGNYERNIQARMEAAEAAQHIENPEEYESKPRLLINDLTKMGMHELRDLATQYGMTADDLAPMKKQDLIFCILKAHTEHGGIIFASGALEILPDGYGFLRSPQNSYLPG